MRKELRLIEKIENYILNQMTEVEKALFDNEMEESVSLKEKVEFQQDFTAAIERFGLKNKAKKAGKRYQFNKVVKGVLGVVAIGIISYGFLTLATTEEIELNINNTVEFNQPIAFPENDSLSSEANHYLDQEVFKINVAKDTVIESTDGVVVRIPANAFETESAEVEVVLQTAVNTADILKAGLSTTTNGELLETGGMFYLDAFDKNKRVGLTKNITVDVPSGDKKAGMQIYDGEKTAKGEINWVAPKPVESFLTPVDILSLDFYPPGYAFKLDEWGLYGKAFRDSLYFSFAFDNACEDCSDCEKLLKGVYKYSTVPQRKITVEERDFLYEDDRPIDKLMTYEEAFILCENGRLDGISGESNCPDPILGEQLFNSNCASCHFPRKDMTGPALLGARARWMENSSEENFYAWVKNSTAIIEGGDTYALSLKSKWGSVMTNQNVTNKQIDHIFAYVEGIFPGTVNSSLLGEATDSLVENPTTISNSLVSVDTIFLGSESEESRLIDDFITGVNPANVQAIWTSNFGKSNLSTKEFEERMPWIHKSCETAILDVYVKNLHQPLSCADSIVIEMTSGEIQEKFIEFAKRGDGRVGVYEDEMYALFDYYEDKKAANVKAVKLAQKEYWETQNQKNKKHKEISSQSDVRSKENKMDIFRQEFKTNLEKAKKELGIPENPPISNPSSYTVTVSNLGWKNIDRKVLDITNARETAEIVFKDKKVTISYEKWSGIIEKSEIYDKVSVYNIPIKFNSYEKLPEKNGKYEYNLNSDLDYQTLVVGWTAQSIFFYQDRQTTKGDYSIRLKPITNEKFESSIVSSLSPIVNMKAEMDYIQYAQKEQTRLNNMQEKILLRSKILPVIFPCKGMDPVLEYHGSFHQPYLGDN